MARKRVSVTKETSTGRNIGFKDNYTKKKYSQDKFVKAIEQNKDGLGDKYHVRKINGVKTPCSNPDSSTDNNLD
ncbi:hypothetical protein [Orenia marismortui]|uniref:DUF3892 domain-containing protein n=1 Tax=Orenia marismortui TaxID=46469 RepID=A0A4V3GXV3_9FIRM|nr:hypothetical protein [Orenia marismortui]TDX49112.1 hypothetical protein C7959_1206 [Orenia marismortui]